MPSSQAAFGCRPSNSLSGLVRPRAIQAGISAAYATALYQGTPIIMATGATAAGVVQVAANAADWIGSFGGVQYTDANGRTQYSKYWPASQAVASQASVWAFIWDDPNIMYEMQIDGTTTQVTAVGQQFNFSAVAGFTVGAGNATTQQSTCALANAGAGATTQGMFRCMDLARNIDNAWGDTYVNIIGQVARHQYVAVKVGL